MGQPKKALDLIGRTPNSPSQAVTISEALVDLGEFAAAEKILRDSMGWEFRNTTPKQHMMRRLGEIKEQQGDYAAAFECYSRAREGLRVTFTIEDAKRELGRVLDAFTAETIAALPKPSVRTRRPVFIVGMPRSGTTLLEKMIAAHPHGAGAGETGALRAQLLRFANPPEAERRWPEVIHQFTADDLDGIVNAYLTATDRYVAPGVERVADKHLQNWMFAGLIAACFPDATMVWIRRDPMDTGISCFERLVPAAMQWCIKQEWVGGMLAINDWMMAHWQKVMPGRMLEVRYEDMVRDPANAIRPVLEAAGLAWDDAVLRHHERPNVGLREPPPTLSADQVKRPVYDTAIGRAGRFGGLLDPMRTAYAAMRQELGLT
jgi:Sulfotransferase family